MGRAVWKGPFVAVQLLRDVINLAGKNPEWWNKTRFQGVSAPETIKTKCRNSVILPDFLGCVAMSQWCNTHPRCQLITR